MPEAIEIRDHESDPYLISGFARFVHIQYRGPAPTPSDMLLRREHAVELHRWLGQWIAEQGQEAGEEGRE